MKQKKTMKKAKISRAKEAMPMRRGAGNGALVRECMTARVDIASPDDTIADAAQRMRNGDFGFLPIGENDRLVGMLTDRDIVIRAVAEGKDPDNTSIRELMTERVLYCFDDDSIEEVARNMGENQVRRLPVLNRAKRLVGILSLGDIAQTRSAREQAKEALTHITEHSHREPMRRSA